MKPLTFIHLPDAPQPFTCVLFWDGDYGVETAVQHFTAKPGADLWRSALAALARDLRRCNSNARVRLTLEQATEITTFAGHLRDVCAPTPSTPHSV
jgi:hypothetical protein